MLQLRRNLQLRRIELGWDKKWGGKYTESPMEPRKVPLQFLLSLLLVCHTLNEKGRRFSASVQCVWALVRSIRVSGWAPTHRHCCDPLLPSNIHLGQPFPLPLPRAAPVALQGLRSCSYLPAEIFFFFFASPELSPPASQDHRRFHFPSCTFAKEMLLWVQCINFYNSCSFLPWKHQPHK